MAVSGAGRKGTCGKAVRSGPAFPSPVWETQSCACAKKKLVIFQCSSLMIQRKAGFQAVPSPRGGPSVATAPPSVLGNLRPHSLGNLRPHSLSWSPSCLWREFSIDGTTCVGSVSPATAAGQFVDISYSKLS